MGCNTSSAVAPFDFKELVEKAGLSYVTFNRQEFKKVGEQLRFCDYVETTALSFCGTRHLEPGPVLNWSLGPEFNIIKRDGDAAADGWVPDKEYVYKLEQRRKFLDRGMGAMLIGTCVNPDLGAFIAIKAENGSSEIDDVLTVEATNETFPKLIKSATVEHLIPAGHVAVRFFPSGYVGSSLCEEMQLFSQAFNPPDDIGGKNRLPDIWNIPKNPEIYTKKELKKAGSNLMARMSALGVMGSLHKKLMKDTPHIYIAVVSVAPQAQGQRVCSRLMRGITTVADEMGWACYLETGSERLEKVYQRYGYETAAAETLAAKCDADTDWPSLTIRVMIRPARK